MFVENPKGLDDLCKISQSGFLRERPLLLKKGLKGAAIAEFIDEIEIVDCFEHVIVLDNVRTIV